MKRGFLDLLDPSNDPEFFWQVISGPPCIIYQGTDKFLAIYICPEVYSEENRQKFFFPRSIISEIFPRENFRLIKLCLVAIQIIRSCDLSI
jgi:hypothetical protein